MTLVSVPMFTFPRVIRGAVAAATFTGSTIDAAGEYIAFIGQATENMAVSHVASYIFTATGSPTMDVRIETVANTGFPSTSLWAANTNIVTGPLSSSSNRVDALTATANINAGDFYAVKFLYNSGTSIAFRFQNMDPVAGIVPYYAYNIGTPTIAALDRNWNIALGSSATDFYSIAGMIPFSHAGALVETYNSGSSPAHRGIRFSVPFPCRVRGIQVPLSSVASGGFEIGIFTDAGAEVSSSVTVFDGDQTAIAASTGNNAANLIFDNPVTLAKDTFYRVGIKATTANNLSVGLLTYPSTDYNEAGPWKTLAQYTTETGGTWTDTAVAKLFQIHLLIDQIDDGAGSGSGTRAYTFA